MDDDRPPDRLADVADRRQKIREARLRTRRHEEMARSMFDGFVVLAATFVGVSVGHGVVWIVFAILALVVVLVGRALALWILMGDVDLGRSVIDTWSDTVDGLERDRRHRFD